MIDTERVADDLAAAIDERSFCAYRIAELESYHRRICERVRNQVGKSLSESNALTKFEILKHGYPIGMTTPVALEVRDAELHALVMAAMVPVVVWAKATALLALVVSLMVPVAELSSAMSPRARPGTDLGLLLAIMPSEPAKADSARPILRVSATAPAPAADNERENCRPAVSDDAAVDDAPTDLRGCLAPDAEAVAAAALDSCRARPKLDVAEPRPASERA